MTSKAAISISHYVIKYLGTPTQKKIQFNLIFKIENCERVGSYMN